MDKSDFWKIYILTQFIPHLDLLNSVIEERLLPSFEKIALEADEMREALFQGLMSSPADDSEDPSDYADIAHKVSLNFYSRMRDVRQTITNLFAPMLFHLWEQQLFIFYRRAFNSSLDKRAHVPPTVEVVKEWLSRSEIYVEKFASWAKICELELVANTVKHAEGRSAKKLRSLRPDLFRQPTRSPISFGFEDVSQFGYMPLAGEGLYLAPEDIRKFVNAGVKFWRELANSLK